MSYGHCLNSRSVQWASKLKNVQNKHLLTSIKGPARALKCHLVIDLAIDLSMTVYDHIGRGRGRGREEMRGDEMRRAEKSMRRKGGREDKKNTRRKR